MKKLPLLASILVSLGCVGASVASENVSFSQCASAVDQFAFVVDVSGSMMQPIGDVKLKAQKEFDRMIEDGQYAMRDRPVPPANDAIDSLRRAQLAKAFIERTSQYVLDSTKIQSALYTVAPFKELVPTGARSTEDYRVALNERLNTGLEVFGRPTWMGQQGLAEFTKHVQGSSAVVLVTDGHFDVKTPGKASPVEALTKFSEANPGSCVHIVSAAYTPAEKQAVEALAKINPCTQTVALEELMLNEELLQDFVGDVFFKGCAPELQSVHFKFDSAVLTQEGKAALMQALDVIKTLDPAKKVTVVGWTDGVGSDAYNAKLSERRAKAAKEFLVKNGVDGSHLSTRGMGKSTKFDNRTVEGRAKNRHVEVIFEQ